MHAIKSRELVSFLHPRYWASWAGLGLLRAISLLPLPVLWLGGALLGQLAICFPLRSRHTVDTNLALCFPDMDVTERRRLRNRHFRAVAQVLLSLGISLWAPQRRLARLIRFRGREHYDRALAEGKRVILLAPHFLVLEIAGLYLSHERPMISMYKSPKNELFDWVLRHSRSRFGGIMIERSAELRPLIRLLREGRPFYYLPDQEPGDADFVFAPFFGIPAATITALSRMARLTDAVVVPCFTRLLPFGTGYEVAFAPALENYPSGDNVQDATQMNAAIECGVRERPDQYMWSYKRFKTRPDNLPSFYETKK
jgi:lipid A biosynthesis lauroyl/palmitoleoyl acyltransferase